MFKRRSTYVMEISGRVKYPLDALRAGSEELANISDDDLRALGAESLVRQAMDVAHEELRRNGQKSKRAFEMGGYDGRRAPKSWSTRPASIGSISRPSLRET